MRTPHLLCVAALSGVSLTVFADDYDVNKDLINLGPPAHGIAVVLAGSESVSNSYQGYDDGLFGFFIAGPDGPNTLLYWTAFNDSDGGDGNNMIDTDQRIHIGWSTADQSSNVLDMYWVDADGERLPDSLIVNCTPDWEVGENPLQHLVLEFENLFDLPLDIVALHLAMFDEPLPLAELNNRNDVLAQALQPVPGADLLPVAPGAVASWQIDEPVPDGAAIVLRYRIGSPDSAAQALDFIQFIATESVPCPEDLTGDGVVDQSDLGELLGHYGVDAGGDIDGDGDTDQADLGALLSAYGQPCP